MKNVFIALIFLFAASSVYGQNYKFSVDSFYSGKSHSATIFKASDALLRKSSYIVDDNAKRYLQRPNTHGSRYYKGHGRYEKYQLDKPLPLKKGKLYLLATDGDSSSLFAHSAGIYLGGYKQERGKATFIREGIGIDKTVVQGTDKTKYYIGFYSKNKRHGQGFYVDAKGKMYAGEWKRGRFLGKTKRTLTPEEEEKIGDYVRKINNLL